MDFRNKKILIFGDSLSHRGSDSNPTVQVGLPSIDRNVSAPGDLFASYLLQYGGAKSARINAKVGRSAYNFFTAREPWQDLLKEDLAYDPDIVFVVLGTNDLNMGLAPTKAKFELLRSYFIKTSPTVIAIGPPAFASTNKMNSTEGVATILRSVFGKDGFIDARSLTSDLTQQGRTGDGVHFTPAGAKIFARRLFDYVSKGEVVASLPKEDVSSSSVTPLLAKENIAKEMAMGFGVIGALGLIGFFVWNRNKRRKLQMITRK